MEDLIISSVLFIITIIAGIFLIKSVIKEVEQRERIEKLANMLRQANTRLKELDRMKTEFLSLATHQIRSPLSAIRGYSSMLLEGDYGKLPKKATGAVTAINRSSVSLISVVNDFLDVSRIEQGRMKYDKEALPLKEIANIVIEQYSPNAEEKGLELSFAPPGEGVNDTVHADPNKLQQVIGNIVDNSIKYTPEGDIELRISNPEPGQVRLSVADTGVGIPEEEIPKLFGKFKRAKGANRVNVHGSGLGMYLAKKIMEDHGGTVWVESDGQGEGSTFHIEMPVAEQGDAPEDEG